MEDTKSLLALVLQKVFYNEPKVVEDTYKHIFNYNNGEKDKEGYEKTLKTIYEFMNDKLPPEILVYLFTLVEMPKEDGCQLPIMEKMHNLYSVMQKTQNLLPESVRPHLLGYLNNPENCMEKPVKKESKGIPNKRSARTDEFLKPAKRARTKKKFGKTIAPESSDEQKKLRSLLDITANYVIKNEQQLKQYYKSKQEAAWKLIHSNCYSGNTLKQCYKTVEDLNKKNKLLRMIENDNITNDIFFDEYQESDIFLKEKHMYEAVYRDPFEVTQELMDGIKMFLEKQC